MVDKSSSSTRQEPNNLSQVVEFGDKNPDLVMLFILTKALQPTYTFVCLNLKKFAILTVTFLLPPGK